MSEVQKESADEEAQEEGLVLFGADKLSSRPIRLRKDRGLNRVNPIPDGRVHCEVQRNDLRASLNR